MKSELEILIEARRLITAPWAWCKGTVSRVDPDCVRIISRCAIGAVTAITKVPSEARAALKALVDSGNLMPPDMFVANAVMDLASDPIDNSDDAYLLAHWNDQSDRTHAEVLDLFDRTIERLKAQRRDARVRELLIQAHVILAEIEKADAPPPAMVTEAA